MKTIAHFVLLTCVAIGGLAVPASAAKGGKAPGAPAGPVLPSVKLRHLIDETLPKINGLAGPNAVKDRTALVEVQADYTAKYNLASATDKPMYQAAVVVMNALVGAVDEHDQAVANFRYSKSVHGPQDKKDMDISNTHQGWGSGRTAEANNAKENKENSDSHKALLAKEEMMNRGAIEAWTNRAGQIRAAVEQVYANELVVEKQTVALRAAAVAATTPAATPPPKPKPQTPTQASAAEQYSPVGTWTGEKSLWVLNEDGTFKHGTGGGEWSWKDQSKGALTLKWKNGRESNATFSPDGRSLQVDLLAGGQATLKR